MVLKIYNETGFEVHGDFVNVDVEDYGDGSFGLTCFNEAGEETEFECEAFDIINDCGVIVADDTEGNGGECDCGEDICPECGPA